MDYNRVVEKQDYSAYGAILTGRSMNTASSNEKYKFTEKERDKESGLDYFRARYYDSEIGRWLSVDPLADKYPGWSPYNYCMNNPINSFDPDGRIVVNSHNRTVSITRQSDGSFGIKEASITIYEGSIKDDLSSGTSKFDGLTLDEAIGAVAGHEIVHGTDGNEINEDIKWEI